MLKILLILAVLSVFLPDVVRGSVCQQKYTVNTYSVGESYYKCGWWGWGSCKSTKQVMTPVTKTRDYCCPGSFGTVEINGCNGVCPTKKAQVAEACNGRICRDYQCDESSIVDTPEPQTLVMNENDNQERLLWTADATCFVQESCPCANGGSCTCSKTVTCTDCTVQSTNGIAEIRDGTKVFRKKCTNTECSDCRQYPGCLNHGVNYLINVKCRASGYDDNDVVTQTLRLNVTKAPEAEIDFPEIDVPVELDTDAQVGDVLVQFGDISIPVGENNVVYSLRGPNSSTTGKPLFRYEESTREIKVNSDLSLEQGGTYTVQLCLSLRRKATCFGVVVKLERTTTTTTTTTTKPVATTRPASNFRCFSYGLYAAKHGMDTWCQEACGRDPANCPYTEFCACRDITVDPYEASDEEPQQVCRPGGVFASSAYMTKIMTAWCTLNCNHGEYSYCPDEEGNVGYCICD